MKLINLLFAAALGSMMLALPAIAQEGPVETITKGCQPELENFCSEVTPGEGRVLACLYAHGDQLSGACEFALYDAAAQLERAVAALSYVANECDADLDKLCSGVAVGEGRLAQCLKDNESEVSSRCIKALEDVGLK